MTGQLASKWERKLRAATCELCRISPLSLVRNGAHYVNGTGESFLGPCTSKHVELLPLFEQAVRDVVEEQKNLGQIYYDDASEQIAELRRKGEQAHLAGQLQQKEAVITLAPRSTIKDVISSAYARAFQEGVEAYKTAIRNATLPPASQEALEQHDAELRKKFSAECERFHNEGRKCSTCSRVDYSAEDVAAEVRSADANKAAMAYIQETASHAMCHAETYTLEEAMNALYRIHQKLDDAAAIAAESPKVTP